MVMKIKNEKGEEVEVYTKDEVEAAKTEATSAAAAAASKLAEEKANAAIEAYKAANPDKTTEIDGLKNKLAEAEARLATAENYNDGDPQRKEQIERLRRERDEAVKAVNDKVTALETTIKNMQNSHVDGWKKAALDKFAGNDAEARKKVEYEFDRYDTASAGSEADIMRRMEKASQMAGVNAPENPGPLDGGSGAGNRGGGNYGGNGGKTEVTQNAKNIGKALGLSEKDLQDHVAAKNAGAQQ